MADWIQVIVALRWSFIFFFSSRRRHTRFDCDWSSDVCSSDLNTDWASPCLPPEAIRADRHRLLGVEHRGAGADQRGGDEQQRVAVGKGKQQIGRASCRERV